MFPRKELNIGGNSYAIFILESGGIDIIKITARKGRSFYCKYGYFEPNEEYRYICGKSDVYFFDQNSANPLRISALIDIQRYLILDNRPQLLPDEINYLLGRSEIEDDFKDKEKAESARAHIQKLANSLGKDAVKYLYEYFDEDIVARHDVEYEAAHKERFRIKKSYGIVPFIPQETFGRRNIAIVIVNDTLLDILIVDPKVDPKRKIRYFDTERYGRFYVRENRTRYRFKKTNVYIVAVNTEDEIQQAQPKLQELEKPVAQPARNVVTPEEEKPVVAESKASPPAKKNKKKQSETDEKLDKVADLLEQLAKSEQEEKGKPKGKKVEEKEKDKPLRKLFAKKKNKEAEPVQDKEQPKEKKKFFERDSGKSKSDLDLYTFKQVTLPVYAGEKEMVEGENKWTEPTYVEEPQTIAINAAKFLPHVNYNDPVILKNIFENAKHQKIGIDLTSKPMVKPGIDPKVIMAIGIVVIMFMIIGIPVLVQFNIINVNGGGGGGGINIFGGLFGGGEKPAENTGEVVKPTGNSTEVIHPTGSNPPAGLPIPQLPQQVHSP